MNDQHLQSGRVERLQANSQAAGGLEPEIANDSLAVSRPTPNSSARRRTNITARFVEQVRASLTYLDHELLSTVARLNVASGTQLRQLLYPDTPTGKRLARKDLARLTERRVLARLERRVGGVRAGSDGFIYALDVVGQRLTRPGRRRYRPPWTPGPTQVAHALAVSGLYVALRASEGPGSTLRSFDAEPAAWRPHVGPGGSRSVLKPDAFVVIQTADYEDHYFVEVDRATEATTRIAAKAKAYVRYWQSGKEQATTGLFPQVLWIVPTEWRAQQLQQALSALPPEHWRLFAVTTTQHAARQMTGANTNEQPKEVNP